MKMKNSTYDTLKWIVQIMLPALITLITTIGIALQWEYTELTALILGAVTTFLGTCLGISSANYKSETEGQ